MIRKIVCNVYIHVYIQQDVYADHLHFYRKYVFLYKSIGADFTNRAIIFCNCALMNNNYASQVL